MLGTAIRACKQRFFAIERDGSDRSFDGIVKVIAEHRLQPDGRDHPRRSPEGYAREGDKPPVIIDASWLPS